ncbi:MAG: magnesium transporter [Candidatus Eisenbacteria bacterium]|nr:magnesium transporter [Candidatus Eisenbacteria bacterium]
MDRPLPVLAQRVDELLEAEDFARIAAILREEHPGDVAELLNFADEDHKARLFHLLPEETGAEVLSRVDDPTLTTLLADLSDEEISRLVDDLPTDDAADIMGQMEDEDAERVLALLEEEDQESLQKLLEYPEESAGGIMESEFVAVKEHGTAEEVVRALRERAEEVEQVHNIYVIDERGRLKGILPIWRVAIARPNASVDRYVEHDVVRVPADMDQEEVANLARRHDLIEIPVVDEEERLIGRITLDDLVDVIHEEAAEDISRMSGTGEEEIHETSPLRISFLRLPWLLIGLAGGIGSAFLMSRFEGQLHRILALAFFVPVITAMGGNVGIQCSSIVVRALALGEMEVYRIWRRVAREFLVASVNGLVIAGLVSLVATVWHGSGLLGLIVGCSMFSSILVASTTGTLFPITLRRLGFDPALATGPFVTTSNDLLNLLIYFAIAAFFLGRI